MKPLIRTQPDDAAALAMENELLRYENVHLRARLKEADKAAQKATDALEAQRGVTPQPGGAEPAVAATNEAREDLVWLLKRLDQSAVGPMFRTRAGFRALRAKYVGGAAE